MLRIKIKINKAKNRNLNWRWFSIPQGLTSPEQRTRQIKLQEGISVERGSIRRSKKGLAIIAITLLFVFFIRFIIFLTKSNEFKKTKSILALLLKQMSTYKIFLNKLNN